LSVLPIRIMGDPVLREKARPVKEFSPALKRLAADMLETMYESQGVGLAAPQVGISERLFVFDDGETGPMAIVNPELYDPDGIQDGEEGCLSIPGIYFNVERANRIRVRGYDLDGNPLDLDGEGLLARILQHETDHVDGILFVDRLSDEDRKAAMRLIREQDLGLVTTDPHTSRSL
jgi:peptide deformylase